MCVAGVFAIRGSVENSNGKQTLDKKRQKGEQKKRASEGERKEKSKG